jgi:hypothetical protein
MPQSNELRRQPCEHETRVAHYGEQHLAQRFRLAHVEPCARRPVARQTELAEPAQCFGGARRGVTDSARECLGAHTIAADHGLRQHGARELRIVREGADDFGGFSRIGQQRRRQRPRFFHGGAHARDAGTNLGRTELRAFHVKQFGDTSRRAVSPGADCRYDTRLF